MNDLGDAKPWYEWPLASEWSHPPGTAFADFSCSEEGGPFTFNGLWQVRHCPCVKLKKTRLILLGPLPHFNGYSPSPDEKAAIALKIQETIAQRNHRIDKFGFYVDEVFLEYWDAERDDLRRRLLARVVEAARNLCRAGQFDSWLTLRAIRVCMKDPAWLSGYARFVGGDIYPAAGILKRKINPDFGTQVKAGVGAKDQENENGRSVTRK